MSRELISEKVEFPYCLVDGERYKLVIVNGVLRFPDIKKETADLNKLIISYFDDKIDLQEVWEEYSQTGCSYGMVMGIFCPFGINNHTVTQGKGKCKEFVLHSGDAEIDAAYNLDYELEYQLELEEVTT